MVPPMEVDANGYDMQMHANVLGNVYDTTQPLQPMNTNLRS
jgi:hypothetical protein